MTAKLKLYRASQLSLYLQAMHTYIVTLGFWKKLVWRSGIPEVTVQKRIQRKGCCEENCKISHNLWTDQKVLKLFEKKLWAKIEHLICLAKEWDRYEQSERGSATVAVWFWYNLLIDKTWSINQAPAHYIPGQKTFCFQTQFLEDMNWFLLW